MVSTRQKMPEVQRKARDQCENQRLQNLTKQAPASGKRCTKFLHEGILLFCNARYFIYIDTDTE